MTNKSVEKLADILQSAFYLKLCDIRCAKNGVYARIEKATNLKENESDDSNLTGKCQLIEHN